MNYLEFDLLSFLLILGVGQGLFISTILLFRRPSSLAIKILAVLLIIFTVNLIEFLLLSSRFYEYVPHLMRVTHPFLFLLGPLFYFFIKAYLRPSFILSKNNFLHLLPFFLAVIYDTQWYFLSAEVKINSMTEALKGINNGVSLMGITVAWIHISQTLTYALLSLREIRQFKRGMPSGNSSLSKKINFLYLFNQTFITYWFIQLIGAITIYVIQYYVLFIDFVLAIINSVFIQLLSFFILIRPHFLSQLSINDKYKDSPLSPELYQELLIRINNLVVKEKIYLDGDLNLQRFSEALSVNKSYVSQVINQEYNLGFSEYINEFRIQKAIELIKDPAAQHLNLLGVAMDSGFNNKTSFNRAFKRKTGKTPSEFKNTLNAAPQKLKHN